MDQFREEAVNLPGDSDFAGDEFEEDVQLLERFPVTKKLVKTIERGDAA